MRRTASWLPARLAASGLLVLLAACSGGGDTGAGSGSDGGAGSAAQGSGDGSGDGSGASVERAADFRAPELGACRPLTPADVEGSSDATEVVACAEEHTAETYAVGPLPKRFADAAYDDERLGRFAYRRCGDTFARFLGTEESRVLRSVLDWAWFRPSEEAWGQGARWYRCDVVGDQVSDDAYAPLPTTARGVLSGLEPDDRFLLCADGATVAGSAKVACSEPHQWRAVTTIKLGQPGDPYPGDRISEVRSRDYCSSSVGGFLGYSLDYEFGYTWFGEGEWKAGNRRSLCWARTDR